MALRWRFPDPSEAAARAEVEARIDGWWAAVAARSPASLEAVDAGLRSEVTRGECWVVTCEERRHLQPLVEHVRARAPATLRVSSGREPMPLSEALALVERRHRLDASRWSASFEPPEHGLLSVTWHGPTAEQIDAAVTLTKALVGEAKVFDWVGDVAAGRGGLRSLLARGRVDVDGFTLAFSEQQREVQARRPAAALQRQGSDEKWSLVQLEPTRTRASVLPGLERLRTGDLALLEAVLVGVPFASARFSRFGEHFAFVRSEAGEDDALRVSLRLEESLDACLGASGRCIGAGTGGAFAFVLLVLSDLDAAALVQTALQQAKAPVNTWLGFFDETLRAEWVGAWPHTPAPGERP